MTDILEHLKEVCKVLSFRGFHVAADNVRKGMAEIQSLRAQDVGADVGSVAARDVLAERRRQVEAEGWTAEHDDAHEEGEIADAAACYAAGCIPLAPARQTAEGGGYVVLWPWSRRWWKPAADRRGDRVKAGALILAEIERIDRATARGNVGANVGSVAAV